LTEKLPYKSAKLPVPLQHEIWHAAGELRGLVRVTAEADHDVAGASVDRNPLNGFGELIAESPMADAKIIREAERPRPDRRTAQRSTQKIAENFR
jgi:hypothetical protein